MLSRGGRGLQLSQGAVTAPVSPREVLNVLQAQACGCHIITTTPDLIAKLSLLGTDLRQYSLHTVKMFHDDTRAAGFKPV